MGTRGHFAHLLYLYAQAHRQDQKQSSAQLGFKM